MAKTPRNLIFLVLLALAVAVIIGLRLTSDSHEPVPQSEGRRALLADQAPVVDQRPLETARRLAGLTATSEEQQLSRDTVRLADHEVDLAFASALRSANEQTTPERAETRTIHQRIRRTEAQVKEQEKRVKQLIAEVASGKGSNQANLQKQVELAQAELALDEDELADAKEDLARAGGDAHSKLQRLLDEHEAGQHASQAVHSDSGSRGVSASVFSASSLVAEWRDWSSLREKQAQIDQARQEALAEGAALSRNHDALEQHVRQEQSQKEGVSEHAVTLLETRKSGTTEDSKSATESALSSLRHLSEDQKNLADLDKRVQDLQQLSTRYGQWGVLVKISKRASLHEILKSVLCILLAALLVLPVGRLIDRFFTGFTLEGKQLLTLREVVHFAVQALAVLVILFVVFGSPSQMSTVLGLAGAGLTVALKDFIVSVFGWFVLMGRHGIRVGDWVEINGVGGEVIEIGLLRTVLLETGNWTEAGHPTGRQVAFVNRYAVEGHYFNFSTSGQWLWDELQVLIPSSQNPYPLIEKIQAIVAKETQNKAQMAEQDWARVTRRYGVRSFSAVPVADVRPTDSGVKVIVRYITRASERYAVHSRLNQAIVELLHRKKVPTAATEALPAPSDAK